ncbi:hypothetical protein B0T10DRAFT_198570 [Thelonectria olida]|uniref:Transmembrane protein n=1 Tax=Thelonectria olida TaxID=1576542 RepID=A0A9P8VUB9_9HYPO|nr:hypothetical protein B0T10DRAFT_198570 [Thelonectria olida]
MRRLSATISPYPVFYRFSSRSAIHSHLTHIFATFTSKLTLLFLSTSLSSLSFYNLLSLLLSCNLFCLSRFFRSFPFLVLFLLLSLAARPPFPPPFLFILLSLPFLPPLSFPPPSLRALFLMLCPVRLPLSFLWRLLSLLFSLCPSLSCRHLSLLF